MRLLKKVFDSLNKLDLREDAHGKTLKMAYASQCATIDAVFNVAVRLQCTRTTANA